MVYRKPQCVHLVDVFNVERVLHVQVGVLGECGGGRDVRSVVGSQTTTCPHHDVSQRIGFPFQSHVSVPVVTTREIGRLTIRKRAMALTIEVLAGVFVLVVAIAMVPSDASVDFQFLSIVVVDVTSQHLLRVQSPSVPPSRIFLLVVGIAHDNQSGVVGKTTSRHPARIAVLSSASNVHVSHISTVHSLLHGEVEHRFLVAVLYTRDT